MIPKQLKPLKKPFRNMAADVLADLEKKDNNRERNHAMRDLDKEINGYLNFDSKNIQSEMKNAFEGKNREKKVEDILKEAANLEPILEEKNDRQLALVKPNMSLADQRK
jgi:hypothetical protein